MLRMCGVMTSAESLKAAMRRALSGTGVDEVTASGEFTLPAHRPTLFPGAVYGFAVELGQIEVSALFEEARARKLSRVSRLKSFQPIEGTLYPLYWGKDKCLGARPYQHLNDPAKTGAIRLSTYEALRGKTIACVSLVVSDYAAAERILRSAHPDMLKTSTVQRGI
jgi:hypothetical protein